MRHLSFFSAFLCLVFFVTEASAQTLRWNTPDEGVTRKSPSAAPAAAASMQSNEVETGYVTYYADYLVGQPTASGEFYRHDLLTAAHRTLPFGTLLKVTRLDNNVSVTVRVNDRGTLCNGCVLSISRSAAEELQMIKSGKILVAVQEVGFSNYSPRPETGLTARGGQAPAASRQPEAYSYNPPVRIDRTPATASTWDPSYDNPNAGRATQAPTSYSAPTTMTPRAYGTPSRPEGTTAATGTYEPGVDYTRRPATAITPRNTQAATRPASYDEMTARSPIRSGVVGNSNEVQVAANAVRGFGIQLGAYSNFANAERRVVSLQEQGINNVFIKQDAQRGLNRVILGPYASSGAAKAELQRLEQQLEVRGLVLSLQ